MHRHPCQDQPREGVRIDKGQPVRILLEKSACIGDEYYRRKATFPLLPKGCMPHKLQDKKQNYIGEDASHKEHQASSSI